MAELLVSSLIWLLFFFLICFVIYIAVDWICARTGLPVVRQVVMVVLGILALIILIEHFVPLLSSSGGHL